MRSYRGICEHVKVLSQTTPVMIRRGLSLSGGMTAATLRKR